MKKGTVSYATHQALAAWVWPSGISLNDAIARHALAHGLSASGLYRALINAGKISQKPRKAAPAPIPPQAPD